MQKIDWNQGWEVSRPGGFLDGFLAAGQKPAITLPHDSLIGEDRSPDSANGPDTAWYDGDTYIYTKHLEAPAGWRGKSVLLELEGVSPNGVVFVNDQFAGDCNYAYSDYKINIGKYLQYGQQNEIKVIARGKLTQTSRWYVGGGLCRPVWLLVGEDVQIAPEGVRITTRNVAEGVATMGVEIRVRQNVPGSRKVHLELELYTPEGAVAAADCIPVTLFDQEPVIAASRMDVADPALWSPELPDLYTAVVRLKDGETVVEEQRIPFGIRTLTLSRAHGLQLNGETIKLRGGCIHHDNGLLGGISLKDAEVRRIRRMKAAGFNAVRSAHNPASSALLEACDEVGMLVMDELFDVWNTSKRDHDYSMFFGRNWQEDMASFVEKDYNHPCVVLYAVGNEIPETGTPGGAAQNRQMANALRALDATRPVVNCINGMFSVMPRMRELLADVTDGATEIPDDINALMTMFDANIDALMCHDVVTQATEETFAGVDVCGYNYMASRYAPDGVRYPNRVILGSETNPDKIGYNWPLVESMDHVIGDFCWTGWDYIGEAGVGKNDYELTFAMYGPWPWYLAYCGDFDICGNRRPQSFYREIVYGLRQTPYVCVERPEHYNQPKYTTNWTWPDVIESWTWPGFEGKPTHVEVYAACKEIALYCNGKLLEKKPVGEEMPNKAVFDVIYTPGKLTAVGLDGETVVGEMTLATAEPAKDIALVSEQTQVPADPMSLAYLELSLVDGAGRLNPSAKAQVTLRVTGPAVLAGFGSADPRSLEKFSDTTRTTFDGRALAVLRSVGEKGTVTVTATAPDFPEKTVVVEFI